MQTKSVNIGKLSIRFRWVVALAVLITMAGFIRLGIWQLDRAQEKSDLQEAFIASGQSEGTPITRVPLAGPRFDILQHQDRRVLLEGEFLNTRNIFLIYQSFEGQPGYEVITPFLLTDNQQIVLVSRGWSGITEVSELSRTLSPLNGPRHIEGQLFIPTEKQAAMSNASQNTDWPLLRRYVNTIELGPLFDGSLFPYVVRLAEGQDGVLVRHWPVVALETGRHFSYALQWFAMAIAVLTVSLILSSNIIQLMRHRPGAKHGDTPDH